MDRAHRESKGVSREIRVLVLDGSPVVRSRLLAALGAFEEVCLVCGGDDLDQGVARARRAGPDLVVLDIRAACGRGLALIRELKDCDPSPVVVVLTSSIEYPYREHCLARGADHCLDKARELDRLDGIVAGLISKRIAVASTVGERS